MKPKPLDNLVSERLLGRKKKQRDVRKASLYYAKRRKKKTPKSDIMKWAPEIIKRKYTNLSDIKS